ncbi:MULTISPECIES: YjbF family lipoprotein [unclassified Salinivibrio]|uniref:YjbF family lipoprotein n=1 Tax=unclassified Salinivibrio TaxID=2636825 RepID=UPI00128E9551|nr:MULTISPECIES: YjbF family lipoprotein [unclassified Salinivibrio]MPS31265.1 YjbF family lipoprotein [Salinivibrio sp. VYel7]MPX92665.1 YjbF family lipoprotein [Salinivibrio sp. VYel9]MPX95651.1 YjbF family lipoprotein [Salinivibrio sp. VYel6]MPY01270.1 YjbF family lipoprotein [Salinivibrio sp. VYel4]MPY02411.1 YjbF family lipoprotein [Salinivibrio sp. VYel5]
MNKPFFPALAVFIALATTGCTQRMQDLSDSFKFAYQGFPDAKKSWDEINALPYASLYAQLDNGPRGFMVLAFAEPSQHPSPNLKWLSGDHEMIVTRNNRIVKTVNFAEGNLTTTQVNSPDPLSIGLSTIHMPHQWSRTLDWQPGNHSGYRADSTFTRGKPQTISVNGTKADTVQYHERVTLPTLNVDFTNHYWVSEDTGRMVKSYQHLAPGLPAVTLTHLKPYQGGADE